MATRFIKIAVLYLAVGVTLGLIMGIRQSFALAPVHAHINLLGWASLALVGLVYHAYPAAAETRLARIHFWLHNLGLPPLMIALALMLSGNAALEPVVGMLSMVVAAGIALFVINVWLAVRPAAAPGALRAGAVAAQ
ncbi:MAG TPA: cytochrome-c oxidase [Casimicrobiaceae bacterium]|jgi:hypothetical protein